MTNISNRLSVDQVKAMIDYMGQHPELATNTLRNMEARVAAKELWTELTKILHSYKGARKTVTGWTRYFSDIKHKLKFKVLYSNRMRSRGLTPKIHTLTTFDKRLLAILGPDFGKPSLNHLYEINDTPTITVIKNEPPVTEFCTTSSELSDRLSEATAHDMYVDQLDHDICHDQSGQDRAATETRPNPADEDRSSSPNVEEQCPKWLIDVEKKRVEAELVRAKAEEQRVSVASKNAEAALIQAQALLKLSEAATVQANALMRIAQLLESRTSTQDVLAI